MVGAAIDWRRTGRLHPAWLLGIGTIVALHLVLVVVSASPIGDAIVRAATAGSPAAVIDPQAYPPSPWA